jgi:hypothetical protein
MSTKKGRTTRNYIPLDVCDVGDIEAFPDSLPDAHASRPFESKDSSAESHARRKAARSSAFTDYHCAPEVV